MCQSTQIDSSPKAVYSRRRKTKYGFHSVFVGTRNADAKITANPTTSWNINLHYVISSKHRTHPRKEKIRINALYQSKINVFTCAFVKERVLNLREHFWRSRDIRLAGVKPTSVQFWSLDKWLYHIAYILNVIWHVWSRLN